MFLASLLQKRKVPTRHPSKLNVYRKGPGKWLQDVIDEAAG